MAERAAAAHVAAGRTVGAALAAAAERLRAGGVPAPRREAEELYAALVCGPTSRAWLDREQPLSDALEARLAEAVRRRIAGVPQAYAAGRANFRGHWLAVDGRVLIPRPETEGLVQLVIDWAGDRVPVVADIGTGSGAIAISLALEAPVAGVIATDVSAEALALAQTNAATTGARDRISFRRGDLCAPLLGDVVDALVSNPPYVATPEWEGLDPAVKDHEPRLALDGGADGLAVIRRLVEAAPGSLAPGGLVALETDARRAEATAAMVAEAGFERVEVREDLFGRPRYVTARQAGSWGH